MRRPTDNWAILLAFVLIGCRGPTNPEGKETKKMPELQGKKAVMIIASQQFRDEELFEPRQALEAAGAAVTLASSSLETATGMLGGTAKADILIGDVDASTYDAVIFVGGMGSSEYFGNPTAHKIAQDAAQQGKIVAAICIAPSTLANAGLLDGKKATCCSSAAGNLKAKGANFTGSPVERDGNIITGEGPTAAAQFGQALVAALAGQ